MLKSFAEVFVWESNEGNSFFVKVMEDELASLAELRMKEESATELSVGLFDTKRNLRVQKGRETQERERREREKSEVGIWICSHRLDFLMSVSGWTCMCKCVSYISWCLPSGGSGTGFPGSLPGEAWRG